MRNKLLTLAFVALTSCSHTEYVFVDGCLEQEPVKQENLTVSLPDFSCSRKVYECPSRVEYTVAKKGEGELSVTIHNTLEDHISYKVNDAKSWQEYPKAMKSCLSVNRPYYPNDERLRLVKWMKTDRYFR